MGKKLKKFLKVVTAIISIGGILYIARDQIKAIIDKLKELKDQEKDENLDAGILMHLTMTMFSRIQRKTAVITSPSTSRTKKKQKKKHLRKRLLPRTTFPTRIRLLTHQKKMINKRTPMLILSA